MLRVGSQIVNNRRLKLFQVKGEISHCLFDHKGNNKSGSNLQHDYTSTEYIKGYFDECIKISRFVWEVLAQLNKQKDLLTLKRVNLLIKLLSEIKIQKQKILCIKHHVGLEAKSPQELSHF